MPSRPVLEPTASSTLLTPDATARMRCSSRSNPTHIALSSGLPLKDGAKLTSPPTVGTPT